MYSWTSFLINEAKCHTHFQYTVISPAPTIIGIVSISASVACYVQLSQSLENLIHQ